MRGSKKVRVLLGIVGIFIEGILFQVTASQQIDNETVPQKLIRHFSQLPLMQHSKYLSEGEQIEEHFDNHTKNHCFSFKGDSQSGLQLINSPDLRGALVEGGSSTHLLWSAINPWDETLETRRYYKFSKVSGENEEVTHPPLHQLYFDHALEPRSGMRILKNDGKEFLIFHQNQWSIFHTEKKNTRLAQLCGIQQVDKITYIFLTEELEGGEFCTKLYGVNPTNLQLEFLVKNSELAEQIKIVLLPSLDEKADDFWTLYPTYVSQNQSNGFKSFPLNMVPFLNPLVTNLFSSVDSFLSPQGVIGRFQISDFSFTLSPPEAQVLVEYDRHPPQTINVIYSRKMGWSVHRENSGLDHSFFVAVPQVEYWDNFKNGRDMISGVLTNPKGSSAYPLVIMLHDDPAQTESILWHPESLFLATQGIATLRLNYPGSTVSANIRTEEFQKVFTSEWPEYINNCAQWLIDHSFVENGKLGIMGRGYGAWLALAAASLNPALYNGIIAHTPPLDAKDYEAKVAHQYGKFSSKSQQFNRLKSNSCKLAAIERDKLADIPLLLLGHALDPVVIEEQIDEWSLALARLSKNKHVYVRIKGEGHELLGCENRSIYLTLIASFLRKQLDVNLKNPVYYEKENTNFQNVRGNEELFS